MELGVSMFSPSSSSVSRRHPLLRGVLWVSFPRFIAPTVALRLPDTRHSVASLPSRRITCRLAGSTGASQVPAKPLLTCRVLRPRGASAPDRFWRFGIAFHLFDSVGHPNSQISRLDHAACMLAVYASPPPLLTDTQDSLPAGGQPWPGDY